MVHLDYRDARPIYVQIADGFREQIAAGILKAGERIPSVRELATELTINPNTIQRAYRELELGGLIASVPGKGSFVSELPKQAAPDQEALWTAFDEAVNALLCAGVTPNEIAARLQKGGSQNA